jgi:hypothetical protein
VKYKGFDFGNAKHQGPLTSAIKPVGVLGRSINRGSYLIDFTALEPLDPSDVIRGGDLFELSPASVKYAFAYANAHIDEIKDRFEAQQRVRD